MFEHISRWGGHSTYYVGGGHRTYFIKLQVGGTPHISYHIKGGGDTAHILSYYRWWGHRTYYVYNKVKDRRVMDGWLDGWMAGWLAGWLDGSLQL